MSRPSWRFIEEFDPASVANDDQVRRKFLEAILEWDGQFMRLGGPGLHANGLTVDGVHLDLTGEEYSLGDVRGHSNPSKEALHISLLTHAMHLGDGSLPCKLFGSVKEARCQLELKADALDKYRESFPHYHGFMAWFDASRGGAPIEPYVHTRYNGMLAWVLYVAVNVLKELGELVLASRFEAHLQEMQQWAVKMSYKGGGKVASMITITPDGSTHQSEKDSTDPFAGELFCLFLDLLANWGDEYGPEERNSLWKDLDRQAWLRHSVLELSSQDGPRLEVMKQDTFSVHEQWKFLLLPYSNAPTLRRLLHSAEKARTWHANLQGQPGFLGSCHVGLDSSQEYVTTFGISDVSRISHDNVRNDHLTPYGTFALFLATPSVGATWLAALLAYAPMLQTAWGIAESCSSKKSDLSQCSEVCPILTWDTKATTDLAILGGNGRMVQRYLQRDGLQSRFFSVLENLYGVFAPALEGERCGFAMPPHLDLQSVQPHKGAREQSGEEWLTLLTDVELYRAVRLSQTDVPVLQATHQWFIEHQVVNGEEEQYCVGSGADWCTTMDGRYKGADLEKLYSLLVEMHDLGAPLYMLARQAPRYKLFFDVDVYGSSLEARGNMFDNQVDELLWESEDMIFLRTLARALLAVYPDFNQDGIEIAAFSSSGYCQVKQRHKASYHLVFPQIVVDRPVKCLDENAEKTQIPARHYVLREHIIRWFSEDDQLENLCEELCKSCNYERVTIEGEEGLHGEDEDLPCLNEWCEVFDENPLWHEPWDGAATGLRLPFTDKAIIKGADATEAVASDAFIGNREEEMTKPRSFSHLPSVGTWLTSLPSALDNVGTEEKTKDESVEENMEALKSRALLVTEGRPKLPLGRWCITESTVTRLPDLLPQAWVELGDISRLDVGDVTPWSEHGIHMDVELEWETCRCPECQQLEACS